MDTILSRGNSTAAELPFILAIHTSQRAATSLYTSERVLRISNGPLQAMHLKNEYHALQRLLLGFFPALFKALAEKNSESMDDSIYIPQGRLDHDLAPPEADLALCTHRALASFSHSASCVHAAAFR